MRRFFVKNIIFIIAINVLVKPIWVFLIDRTVQNRVPGGEYGTYQALLSLSIIFQIVLDFGITSYNSRTIAQNPDKLPVLFPAMLAARLMLISLYMLLAFSWGYLLGYRGWELKILLGTLAIQSLNSLLSFIRSNIAALHRFKTDGILSITDRLLMVAICGFLLVNPSTASKFRIEWFILTQIVCYSITAVAAYIVLTKVAQVRLKLTFDFPVVIKVIRGSIPYALLIFQMSIYNRADAMMIERLCTNGKIQADIWASAFRQLDMANILGLMFATMLLPLFGRMLSHKNNVQPIIKLCANLLLPFSFIVAVTGIFFSSDVMHLLYKSAGGDDRNSYRLVFSWLMGSFPAWCAMYIYSTLLTANGNLKILNVIAFCGVVFNLAMNFYLIPRYNAVGGAVTSCLTQTLLSVCFIIVSTRIIKLPVHPKWIVSLAGFLLFVLGLAYLIVSFTHFGWMLQASTLVIAGLAGMFVFRFVSIGSIKELMAKKQS